jgi:hypothetical protein
MEKKKKKKKKRRRRVPLHDNREWQERAEGEKKPSP